MYTTSYFLNKIEGYTTPNSLNGGGFAAVICNYLILKADNTTYSEIKTLQKGGIYLFDVQHSAKLDIQNNTIEDISSKQGGAFMYMLVQQNISMNISNNSIACRSTFVNSSFYQFQTNVLNYSSSQAS